MINSSDEKFINELADELGTLLEPNHLEILTNRLTARLNRIKIGAVNFDEIASKKSRVTCPTDPSHDICKNGKDRNNRQRYICKICNTSFFANNKTLTSYLNQDTSMWVKFLQGTLEKKTLNELSDECNISVATAHSWRLRIFYALDIILSNIKLSGVIIADDTRINYNLKGNHDNDFIMPRSARSRGKGNTKQNYQKNSISVLCAIDDSNRSFSKIVGFGNPSGSRIAEGFKNKIEYSSSNILVTDGAQYFTKTVKEYNLSQWNRNTTKVIGNKRIPNTSGVYHIQRINALHSRLKTFIRTYKGISSKYLPGYLLLFDYIENNKGVDKAFMYKEILTAMAVAPPLTQEELENSYIVPVSNGPEKELWERKIPVVEQRIYKDWYRGEKIDTITNKFKISRRKIYTIRDKVEKYKVHDTIMKEKPKTSRLPRTLAPISERDLQVFMFSYRDGNTYSKAATEFGISKATVGNIIKALKNRPELSHIKKHSNQQNAEERHKKIYDDFKFLTYTGRKQNEIIALLKTKYNLRPKYLYNLIYDFKGRDSTADFKYRWSKERKSLPPYEYYKFLQERNRKVVSDIEQYIKLGESNTKASIFKFVAEKYSISVPQIERIYYHQSTELHLYDNYISNTQAAGDNSGAGDKRRNCLEEA